MTNPREARTSRMHSCVASNAVALSVAIGLAMVAAPRAQAQDLTTLYSFCSQTNCTDGATPSGVLVQGSDENFYGTTVQGGASSSWTIFKITPSGVLTTIYSFNGVADGLNPRAGLVQGSDGNLYGTMELNMYWTLQGRFPVEVYGSGTVFQFTPSGGLTNVYEFCMQTVPGTCEKIEFRHVINSVRH